MNSSDMLKASLFSVIAIFAGSAQLLGARCEDVKKLSLPNVTLSMFLGTKLAVALPLAPAEEQD